MMFDLAVVGGGPAGATAARIAAKLGLSTVLFEAAEFPRLKPCGGALSEQAMSHLDFPVPSFLQEADVFGARVHFQNNTVTARFPDRIATIVSRASFDSYLLEQARAAGTEVHEQHRVIRLDELSDHVVIHSPVGATAARYCIIASGATGDLPHTVRAPLEKQEYSVAVELDLPAPNEVVHDHSNGLVDVYFGISRMGYGWVFPHEGRFNIGIAGIASRFRSPRLTLDSFVDSLPGPLCERKSVATNRVGFPIPAGGVRRKVAHRRLLLAGDSAGLVDSFLGEGIAYAIRSGALAAQAVATARRPAASYTAWCARELLPELRYSLILAKLVHRFPTTLLRLFATNDTVLEGFLKVHARKATYAEFVRFFVPRIPFLMLKQRKDEAS
jgi:geranylgeranyl reductase family protein